MTRITGFLSLSPGDKVRVSTAAVLLLSLRRVIGIMSFSKTRSWLIRIVNSLEGAVPRRVPPEQIAWAVEVCDRHLPGERKCLVRSMTTEAILRLHGYEPNHRIGVRKEDSSVEAHSWIEYEGDVLIGGLEDLSVFTPLPPVEWEEMV